jgi:hypothetical protein
MNLERKLEAYPGPLPPHFVARTTKRGAEHLPKESSNRKENYKMPNNSPSKLGWGNLECMFCMGATSRALQRQHKAGDWQGPPSPLPAPTYSPAWADSAGI